jgi:hypothetical protein
MDEKDKGKGDYKAAKDFQKAEHEFAKDKDTVAAKARQAANALDGEEGAELEQARKESAKGQPKS